MGIRQTTLLTCDLARSPGRGALPPAPSTKTGSIARNTTPQQKNDSTGNAPETVVLCHLTSKNSLSTTVE
jgi:hypothetical protein